MPSFCGLLGLYTLGKKFGRPKHTVRLGSQIDWVLLKICLAGVAYHTYRPVKDFCPRDTDLTVHRMTAHFPLNNNMQTDIGHTGLLP